ncbi:MAG: carbon monoxide dehydrogenase subunit G [Alphaproteobacteria bacterium]
MQMSGEQRIPAAREQVWAALNDPAVLQACIPGCDSLEPVGEDGYKATVTAKVGPVKAKFAGQVTLSDIDPPNGYTISGEGKGGAAGFARGGAKVHLAEDGDGTLMTYEVDANVGGKLAQLGSRLIDGTARKMADEFFAKFSELAVSHGGVAPAAEAPAPAPETTPDTSDYPTAPTTAVDEATAEAEAEAEPAPEPAPEPEPARAAAPPPPTPAPSSGLPTWVWGAGVIVLIAVGLYLFAF